MGAKFSLSRLNKYMGNGSVPTINTTTEVVTTETVTNQVITNLTSSTALFTGAVTFQGDVTGISTPSNTALTVGVDSNLITAAGSTNADAAALPSGSTVYRVNSSVSDSAGIKLNAGDASVGRIVYIVNEGTKKCRVYPNAGAQIDAETVTTGYIEALSGKATVLGYYMNNKWFWSKVAP